MFINRCDELSFLEKRWKGGRAELIILYGRRRVGKTYLIRRFMKGKRGVYVFVSKLGQPLLDEFSNSIMEQLGLNFRPSIRTFRDLFLLLEKLTSDERLLVAIDEFQRMAEAEPSFLMELQRCWDEFLSESRIMLVLMGSAVGVIERLGLSQASPIFGRRTGQIKLKPFDFSCSKEFFRRYEPEDKVRAYSVFGGVPAYLSMVDDSKGLMENISSLILDNKGPLYEEPYFLLSQETREPTRYMSILEAMSQGATKLGEIASKAGMSSSDLPRYLKVLEADLDLVERRYPLTERRRGRTRYHLKDNFIGFWFKLVRPHLTLLEMGEKERVLEVVRIQIDEHASLAFEDVAMEHFSREVVKLGASRVGRWWSRDVELDGIAIDEVRGRAYFMEAKWTNKPLKRSVLNDLIRKASEFRWRIGSREEFYFIYSRSGFEFEEDNGIRLVDLNELMKELGCPPPPKS